MQEAAAAREPAGHTDRVEDFVAIVGGLAVLAIGCVVVRNGSVPAVERAVFHAINDLPEWLYPVAWPMQMFGVLVVGPLVAVVALVLRRWRLAAGAVLATVLKLVTERMVKAIVSRERPATSIGPDVELRGDVSASGESFVSGHAILVAALAGIITPYLPGRWKIVPWLFVLATMVGRTYVGAHNPLDVVCGVGLGIAVAGVLNLVLRPTSARRAGATALVAAMALTPSACGGSPADSASRTTLADSAITVGSFDFPESVILAEVYSQGLESAGFDVDRAFSLGPREFAAPALTSGLIEFLPEYAGTASEFHSGGDAEPTSDVAETHAELVDAISDRGVVALAPAPAQDTNTFVVTVETADRLGLETLGDLGTVSGSLVFGGPPECAQRLLCLPGLEEVYGVTFGEAVSLDAGGPLTVSALQSGQIDVGLMFSTDPTIAELGLVELVDNAGLQPAENITPLVHSSVFDEWGDQLVDVVDAISARLTTAEVRNLNDAAGDAGADVAAIAANWWTEVTSS
jgi:osmoprotectant transport system substrate-binding protein